MNDEDVVMSLRGCAVKTVLINDDTDDYIFENWVKLLDISEWLLKRTPQVEKLFNINYKGRTAIWFSQPIKVSYFLSSINFKELRGHYFLVFHGKVCTTVQVD